MSETTCPRCGSEASGNFCSRCGAPLRAGAGEARHCASCGTELSPGALYCRECGEAVGSPPRKPRSATLPWVLSAVALVGFCVVIAVLVIGGSSPRTGDAPLTGGIVRGEDVGSAGEAATGMPSAAELAQMPPREAADRLFDRAMREHERGDFERARFFAQMGLQAYGQVPPGEVDADARFHIGLLELLQGGRDAARATARTMLEEDPDHLLGLILAARAADMEGDSATARSYRERLRSAIASGGIPDRPEYEAHRALIEREGGAAEGGAPAQGGAPPEGAPGEGAPGEGS